jgi:hypothetical protein
VGRRRDLFPGRINRPAGIADAAVKKSIRPEKTRNRPSVPFGFGFGRRVKNPAEAGIPAAAPHCHLSMASRRTSNNFEPLFLRLEMVKRKSLLVLFALPFPIIMRMAIHCASFCFDNATEARKILTGD